MRIAALMKVAGNPTLEAIAPQIAAPPAIPS
jgi:hypothetical protein